MITTPMPNVTSRTPSLVSGHESVPKEAVKRSRKSGPKSRNACIVCKIRHVKCDETKPFCTRCTSTGRKCDGYAPSKTAKSEFWKRDLIHVLPRQPERHRDLAAPVPHNPFVDLQGSYNERRSFHYFRARNMAESPGNFEPYFWERIVLQLSHKYPPVKQSLLALSAIYEEHERNSGKVESSIARYSAVALQQYSKAVRELAAYLATGEQDTTVALISCLIFVWIEFLQGDLETGIRHLKSGLRIISGQTSSQLVPLSQEVKDINASLDRSFARLQIQAEIHGGFPVDFPKLTKTSAKHSAPVPRSFNNIFDAREWLDSELIASFKFLQRLQTMTAGVEADFVAIETTRLQHLERLDAWSEATKRMTIESVPLEGHLYSTGVLYLQLYYTAVSIIFKTITKTSEMDYDNYLPDFQRVYSISKSLFDSAKSGAPMLSFDMCIIPPLFFLVLKCRDLTLRRKAIALLELAPYQEGMWGRDGVLAWCKWKTEVEEKGRGDVPESEPLPESARLSSQNLDGGNSGTLGDIVPGYTVTWKTSVEWYSKAVSRMARNDLMDVFF
ncbi:hypothetical protein BKA65DRAFT_515167 [Rhexocercosporidium sp. MPI-PUGE-AT-0058]|nr:hypothetical protein BKA65DRAFT_515167 [Rhexocercosporidium sp. MPI-PUGE-AT-0058]